MSVPKRFNVRVYGILHKEGQILVNEEMIRGRKVIKLPGGGLEWGEGTKDCLIREWKEELDLDIKIADHFYTTDFFQHSAFDDSQVISIYYFVTVATLPDILVNHVENERTYWLPINRIDSETFTLPIDRLVGGLLQEYFSAGTL
ncbi:MAG: NUDIX domain-containing protein [Sphingobacteriales bacterium]|nr:MAG: NUDIX domain-containing protein [Sphingobacteriales bacterium]